METLGTYHRQRDLLVPEDLLGLDIDIVGAGALGGAILVALCKLGFGIHNRIAIWDHDRCEAHNEPNQWFTHRHVLLNQPKVDALSDMIAWICNDRSLEPLAQSFTGAEKRPVGPVVILAVDSIEQRRLIWENLKRRDDVEFVLDARMGAEIVDIYCVDKSRDDPGPYELSLGGGDPAEEPGCRQSVFYNVLCAAGFVGSLLRAYAKGEPLQRHLVFDSRNFLIESWDH